MRESWKKLGDLLPDGYHTVGATVELDFDPTGKFGRYMDRRLKRLVKRHRRRWPTQQVSATDREALGIRPRQDTKPQE